MSAMSELAIAVMEGGGVPCECGRSNCAGTFSARKEGEFVHLKMRPGEGCLWYDLYLTPRSAQALAILLAEVARTDEDLISDREGANSGRY